MSTPFNAETHGPLHGVKVLDIATVFAGPMAATMLGDFGADVIKIEHPTKADSVRWHGASKDGVGLWWKIIGRNKRTITLYLGAPEGQEIFKKLVAEADILIENFRPGTLERWGLSPETLHEINPGLVIARVTGFGQFGPYSKRPGFGTLAEAMSGFAAITGEPDGPPTLPPFGLADGIAGLTAAYAIMVALHSKNQTGSGQVIDLAIIEPILTVLGPQIIAYDQLGELQPRLGNRSSNNAPRNTYKTRDENWVAISTSAQSVAERVMHLVGRPELIEEPWFASGSERATHSDVLDEAVSSWISQRDRDAVMQAFEGADAAIAPIYDVRDIYADPQFEALGSIVSIPDEELGEVKMQNVLFRLSETPGEIRHAGSAQGLNTLEVLESLGYSEEETKQFRSDGII